MELLVGGTTDLDSLSTTTAALPGQEPEPAVAKAEKEGHEVRVA